MLGKSILSLRPASCRCVPRQYWFSTCPAMLREKNPKDDHRKRENNKRHGKKHDFHEHTSIHHPSNPQNRPPFTKPSLESYLRYFQRSEDVQRKLRGMGLPKPIQIEPFCLDLLNNKLSMATDEVIQRISKSSPEKIIVPLLYNWAIQQLSSVESQMLQELSRMSDLRKPIDWYPTARAMKRKIVMHVGPTNSGKTYHALKHLTDLKNVPGSSTVYCGPLRLLAHEVYERLNAQGHPCSLLTGEERKETNGALAVACTVEMVDIGREWDLAVIDEIQMLADPDRGWAWTQALLGLPAKEIHVCGETTAVPLVKDLLQELGDEVEVREYERLSPLEVSDISLHSKWHNVEPGDCIVTFSRRDIFTTKQAIEHATGLQCALIYGKLPPETRVEQAKLFNDANSPLSVLVASDAVGMGLNLRIKRMIFKTFKKKFQETFRYLAVSQVKQIAGRAGRYGLHGKDQIGQVMAFDERDVPFLKRTMKLMPPALSQAGLMPTLTQVEAFARQWPNDTLSTLLTKFEMVAQLDGRFFLCNLKDLKVVADLLQPIPLSLADRYQLITTPVNIRSNQAMKAMYKYGMVQSRVSGFTMDGHSGSSVLSQTVQLPKHVSATPNALQELETIHRIIGMYRWLSYRFPEAFPELSRANMLKHECEAMINKVLLQMNRQEIQPEEEEEELVEVPKY